MSHNKIKEIPSTITNLTNLQVLYLDNNCITSVPSELSALTSLLSLSLRSNQLSSIPLQIVSLKLRTLDISDNPLETNYHNISVPDGSERKRIRQLESTNVDTM